VHDADLKRLRDMYGLHLSADWNRTRSAYYVEQRLRGALVVPRIHPAEVAFTAPADMRRGLLRRQLVQRRSDWPEEYR
jgi:hypothetical protein